ncbi:MAG: tRNA (adenosine(37)-N6)-dimethylallyltransferase MiaA [Candidatus Magasanikbacteria bacterium]|nr:tRNA (adenosine(37)-N6)-dimethylallyltransferase MiaA [Candidatus Magasanikbacteria bacterium]
MVEQLLKIIAVVGPTASGKTALGIALAKKFNGEIISADSRQVYKSMDIGTAKVEGEKKTDELGRQFILAEGVPHYGINLIEPSEIFSAAEFKQYALAVIAEIGRRERLPILVGGTGLYLKAIVENLQIPAVAPDFKLRENLEKKNLSDLVEELKKIDPLSVERIDLKNKRRVMRALEAVLSSGRSFAGNWKKGPRLFQSLEIGIDLPRTELYRRIDKRVETQIQQGMIEETKRLIEKWYKWSWPSMTGIGYKEIGMYLRGEISLDKAKELTKFRIHDYARRQLTWFRKNKDIQWVKDYREAENLTRIFLG